MKRFPGCINFKINYNSLTGNLTVSRDGCHIIFRTKYHSSNQGPKLFEVLKRQSLEGFAILHTTVSTILLSCLQVIVEDYQRQNPLVVLLQPL